MNRLHLLGLCFALPLLAAKLSAQEIIPPVAPTDRFGQVVQSHQEFYARNGSGRATGFRQFRRWQHLFSARSYPSGDPVNITALAWVNHFSAVRAPEFAARRAAAVDAGIGTGNWRALGPAQPMSDKGGGDIGRVNAIAFHPAQPHTIYAGTPSAGLWRSPDDGVTWAGMTDGLPLLGITDIAIDPREPDTVYILSGDGEGGAGMYGVSSVGVLKSQDGGRTWNPTGLAWRTNQAEYGHRLALNPRQPKILLAASSAGLFRTDDGGESWTQQDARTKRPFLAVACVDARTAWMISGGRRGRASMGRVAASGREDESGARLARRRRGDNEGRTG